MGRQTLVSRILGLGPPTRFPLVCVSFASAHGAGPNLVTILASSARVREACRYCTTRREATAERVGVAGKCWNCEEGCGRLDASPDKALKRNEASAKSRQ